MLFASICVIAAYPPTHIRVWLKHPMLVGVKIWALAHLLANGDLAGIILFTTVLAWAVWSRISMKWRPAPSYPAPKWVADGVAVAAGLRAIPPPRQALPSLCHRPRGVARMSIEPTRRITAPELRARKGKEPIVALTSYHAHTARILDPYVDFLLVGDSLGMVMHGLETTVPVTLEMMILQGHAVMRGSQRALVVVDMPFGSYEASKEDAFRSAARVLKETGCGAIKLEGGAKMAETVRFLSERGVPVMGHVGLTPQAVNALGSFKALGREEKDWAPFLEDARAIAEAGAFSMVIEAVAEPLAKRITEAVPIPTIGIGASPACDGQILVLEDMLGLSPRVPKFVKKYGELAGGIEAAVKEYAREVRNREFPGLANVYPLKAKA